MALGKLQSVAKNMCWFFHRIRRLRLLPFAIPPQFAKTVCPRLPPGYCALGWKEIDYGPVFTLDFWLPAYNFPNANNK